MKTVINEEFHNELSDLLEKYGMIIEKFDFNTNYSNSRLAVEVYNVHPEERRS